MQVAYNDQNDRASLRVMLLRTHAQTPTACIMGSANRMVGSEPCTSQKNRAGFFVYILSVIIVPIFLDFVTKHEHLTTNEAMWGERDGRRKNRVAVTHNFPHHIYIHLPWYPKKGL